MISGRLRPFFAARPTPRLAFDAMIPKELFDRFAAPAPNPDLDAAFASACRDFLRSAPGWRGVSPASAPPRAEGDPPFDFWAVSASGENWAVVCDRTARGDKLGPALAARPHSAAPDGAGALWMTASAARGSGKGGSEPPSWPGVLRIDWLDMLAVDLDWARWAEGGALARVRRKALKAHQRRAAASVLRLLRAEDRAKLVMPCGSGKTLCAVRLMDRLVGEGEWGLMMFPSLALLDQTYKEAALQCERPFLAFALCSDDSVGAGAALGGADAQGAALSDLPYPASTDGEATGRAMRLAVERDPKARAIVFSTYQSSAAAALAQKTAGAPYAFAVMDEAHRTAVAQSRPDSAFALAHGLGANPKMLCRKRLYMTATPRIYSPDAKALAALAAKRLAADPPKAVEGAADRNQKGGAEGAPDGIDRLERGAAGAGSDAGAPGSGPAWGLLSMDDEAVFGKTAYELSFSRALELGLLSDYRLRAILIPKIAVAPAANALNAMTGSAFDAKTVAEVYAACAYLAGADFVCGSDPTAPCDSDAPPNGRAVAFCSSIAASRKRAACFDAMRAAFSRQKGELFEGLPVAPVLAPEMAFDHVDGSMRQWMRQQKLDWLRQGGGGEASGRGAKRGARTLCNARCLTEGVDVPALSAAVFFDPKRSPIDVAQAVGRIMRKSEGKSIGCVALPIASGAASWAELEGAIDGKEMDPAWTALGALRSHDDRLAGARFRDLALSVSLALEPERIDGFFRRFAQSKGSAPKTGDSRAEGAPIGPGAERAKGRGARDGSARFSDADALIRAKEERRMEAERRNRFALVADDQAAADPFAERALRLKARAADARRGLREAHPGLVEEGGEGYLPALARMGTEFRSKAPKKLGDANYWAYFAAMAARIAPELSRRVRALPSGSAEVARAFDKAGAVLSKGQGAKLGRGDLADMAVQHLLAAPIFEALFGPGALSEGLGLALSELAQALRPFGIDRETESLSAFYDQVRRLSSVAQTETERQETVRRLYDGFFAGAFKKDSERLGVVYTPREIVDFILRSCASLLESRFSARIDDERVAVLDPFAGTGAFFARLIENGMADGRLARLAGSGEGGAGFGALRRASDGGAGLKAFEEEAGLEGGSRRQGGEKLYSNEIVPIAHYVGAVNLRASARSRFARARESGLGPLGKRLQGLGEKETRLLADKAATRLLRGAKFRDTFAAYDAMLGGGGPDACAANRDGPTVILGNPPYSSGQSDANLDNKNLVYDNVYGRIAQTYSARSKAINKKSLYDTYKLAFRYASDAVGRRGIVAFVSNGSFLGDNSSEGLRASFVEEFDDVFCVDLRGNVRKYIQDRKSGEGENVFGQGSMTPICVTFLVRDGSRGAGDAKRKARIRYWAVGDKLSAATKLAILDSFADLGDIPFCDVVPNADGDWLDQRSEEYARFLPAIDPATKMRDGQEIFRVFSSGVASAKDAWLYGIDREQLEAKAKSYLEAYELERRAFAADPTRPALIDPRRINWSEGVERRCRKGQVVKFDPGRIGVAHYRPFFKTGVYFDRALFERSYRFPMLFPTKAARNLAIVCSAKSTAARFGALMVDCVADHGILPSNQCLPLYYFEPLDADAARRDPWVETEGGGADLSSPPGAACAKARGAALGLARDGGLGMRDPLDLAGPIPRGFARKDAIRDGVLALFRRAYGDESIEKGDIFFYVYAVMNSAQYVGPFKNDLARDNPRIPLCREFWRYSEIGARLARLHLGFETGPLLAGAALIVDGSFYGPADEAGVARLSAEHPSLLHSGTAKWVKTRKNSRPDKKNAAQSAADSFGGLAVSFNRRLTVAGIPEGVQRYELCGKSAMDWFFDRHRPRVDKLSGIVNDPNRRQGDPSYSLKLMLRLAEMSLRSVDLIDSLPDRLDILR